MAYENYNFVNWTAGTPITSQRLGQMSTNIDQVKDAESQKPYGLLKFTSTSTSTSNISDFANSHLVVELKDETSTGGADNSVNADLDRYVKITFNFPGFTILGAGAEDSTYFVQIYQGEFSSNGKVLKSSWKATPHTYSYIDVATAAADIANEKLKASAQRTTVGAGTYSFLMSTGGGLSGAAFHVSVRREQGASTANAPEFFIDCASTQAQLYVEDVGPTL